MHTYPLQNTIQRTFYILVYMKNKLDKSYYLIEHINLTKGNAYLHTTKYHTAHIIYISIHEKQVR